VSRPKATTTLSDRVERDELLAAIEVYVKPGPLDTQTGLFGREPFQQLAEYERRAEATAADLRRLLAVANRIKGRKRALDG
jgi:hypothetical protein